MAHNAPIGIKALSAAILFAPTLGIHYRRYANMSQFNCTNATPADICTLVCNVAEGSSANQFTFNCGNAGECHMQCTKEKCLHTGFVHANHSLSFHASSAAIQCFKDAAINLPDTGNATFGINNTDRGLSEMIVNAGANTQNILIDCTELSTAFTDECKDMVIHAETAQYLQITAGANSKIGASKTGRVQIYCPHNSLYAGPQIAPCFIDLYDGAELDKVNIYTLNGAPKDVWINVSTAAVFGDVKIQCNISAPDLVTYPLDPTSASSADCWVTDAPTASPGRSPSGLPSISPSVSPTGSTQFPSSSPNNEPTNQQMNEPTQSMSNPSIQPTLQPVTSPSRSPSSSSNPSIAPSTNPIVQHQYMATTELEGIPDMSSTSLFMTGTSSTALLSTFLSSEYTGNLSAASSMNTTFLILIVCTAFVVCTCCFFGCCALYMLRSQRRETPRTPSGPSKTVELEPVHTRAFHSQSDENGVVHIVHQAAAIQPATTGMNTRDDRESAKAPMVQGERNMSMVTTMSEGIVKQRKAMAVMPDQLEEETELASSFGSSKDANRKLLSDAVASQRNDAQHENALHVTDFGLDIQPRVVVDEEEEEKEDEHSDESHESDTEDDEEHLNVLHEPHRTATEDMPAINVQNWKNWKSVNMTKG